MVSLVWQSSQERRDQMSVHVVPSDSGPVLGLLDSHVESFFAHLCAQGYAERTLRKKRSIARAFARWTRCRKVAVGDLDDSHAAAFLGCGPRRRKAQTALESATLRLLLGYLRLTGVVSSAVAAVEVSPTDALLQDYVDY
jgi:hypothetical protein